MDTIRHKYYYCPSDQYACPYSQKLYMGSIMNIHELTELISNTGWGYDVVFPLMHNAYRNDGDAGIMKLFHEMTDLRIDNIRRGHYIMTYYI